MSDWANEVTIYQAEWFGFYCIAVIIIVIIAFELSIFTNATRKK